MEDGRWRTARSFGLHDLLVLSKLADQIPPAIYEQREPPAGDDA